MSEGPRSYSREELAVLVRRCGVAQTVAHLRSRREGEEFIATLAQALGVSELDRTLGEADTALLLRATGEALRLLEGA